MAQLTLPEFEQDSKKQKTRRESFLEKMGDLTSLADPCGAFELNQRRNFSTKTAKPDNPAISGPGPPPLQEDIIIRIKTAATTASTTIPTIGSTNAAMPIESSENAPNIVRHPLILMKASSRKNAMNNFRFFGNRSQNSKFIVCRSSLLCLRSHQRNTIRAPRPHVLHVQRYRVGSRRNYP